MLYKMDNATFGGDIPSLPQWTGAPRVMIQVQAVLYASLAASIFSAFLAMLGKQWLNRYASTGMRGTAVERSQDRQRKLGGIIAWYFDHVMESLPLMLQFALLLLGCALSRYLWEIEVTVACVIIGATAFGVIFYAFVIVAGTASSSCPYQTPWARMLRHTPHVLRHIPHILRHVRQLFQYIHNILRCICHNLRRILRYIRSLLIIRRSSSHPVSVVSAHNRARSARSNRARRLNQRTVILDSQCISWTLQTSLERGIRLSTLKFLEATPILAEFTPALVLDCFDVLIDCIKVNEHNLVIIQGMEQLAEAAAMCFFLTYSHLSIVDLMSASLVRVRRRYGRIFPHNFDSGGLPFPHILGTIHEAIHWGVEVPIKWREYKPTNHECAAVAHGLSKLCWSKYRLAQVPSLYFSFALHYLSQDPLPPPSVIADCLRIITIDLGCDVPRAMVLRERCVHVRQIPTTLLTKIQCTTEGDF